MCIFCRIWLPFIFNQEQLFFNLKEEYPFRLWYHSWLLFVIVSNCIEIALVNEYNNENILARSLRSLTHILNLL